MNVFSGWYFRLRSFFIGKALAKSRDIIEQAELKIVFSLLIFMLIFSLLNLVYLGWIAEWVVLGFTLTFSSLFILAFGLLRMQNDNYLPAQILLLSLLLLSLIYMVFYQGKMPMIDGFYYVFYILLAFGILGYTWGAGVAIFISLIVVFLSLNETFGWDLLNFGQHSDPEAENHPIGLVFAIVMLTYVIHLFVKTNNQALYQMAVRNQVIAMKNETIFASLRYAKRLQNVLIPTSESIRNYFQNSKVLFKAKSEVSGNLYWLKSYGDIVQFAVFDTLKHGVPGAMLTFVVTNGLREITSGNQPKNPEQVLTALNDFWIKTHTLHFKAENLNISYCSYHTPTQTLTYTGANQSILLMRDGAIQILDTHNPAVGEISFQSSFKQQSKELQKGDVLFLFTDGFRKQIGSANGMALGEKSLHEFLSSNTDESIHRQMDALQEYMKAWMGDMVQSDDWCAWGIRI